MVSLVENELFLMPSILASAYTAVEEETNSRRLTPAIAAALAATAPARNVRRFKYKLFGVISDDGISTGFLISMERPCSKCTRIVRRWIAGWIGVLSDRTHDGWKSCNGALSWKGPKRRRRKQRRYSAYNIL